jgi:flagellar basal-body rod modification protein FlgD
MTTNPIARAEDASSPYDQQTAGDSTSTGNSKNTSNVSQDEFLQLLVAQLKNQNPLNPTNSDQFMSELAQFSQLQQVIGIHQDLDSLVAADGSQATKS